MKKLFLFFIAFLFFSLVQAQNVGIGVTTPKARLEIKGINSSIDTNALLISNSVDDTLLKLNNDGKLTIGSIQRDFGQLQIISNAKLDLPNLLITGTNFQGNTGRFFSDLRFNGTGSNHYWRLASLVYGADDPTFDYAKYNNLTLQTDSLPFIMNVNGDGRIGLGSGSPNGFLEIRNDPGNSGDMPQLMLTGTGLANRSYIRMSTADYLHNWFIRGQYNNPFANFIIGFDNTTMFSVDETGQTSLGGGGGGTNKGQVNLAYNSTTSKAHLLLYETESNDYSRLMFQNGSSITANWQIAGLLSSTNSNSRLNFYNDATGNLMSITGDGKVGIGQINPAEKLDVNGNAIINGSLKITGGSPGLGKSLVSDATGNASWATPAGTIAFSGHNASMCGVSTVLSFITPFVTAVITSSSQKIIVTAHAGLGSTAVGGSGNLDIYPGYQPNGGGAITTLSGGMFGLTCPQNGRQVYSISGQFTGLAPGTYNFGMVGQSTNAANWNNNEWGYVMVMVVN